MVDAYCALASHSKLIFILTFVYIQFHAIYLTSIFLPCMVQTDRQTDRQTLFISIHHNKENKNVNQINQENYYR